MGLYIAFSPTEYQGIGEFNLMNGFNNFIVLLACIFMAGCTCIEKKMFNTEIAIERYLSGLHLKTTSIDEHGIYYLEGGEGETVMLVHGFTADKDSWIRFAKSIIGHNHVVIVDLPGHGQSTYCKQCSYSITSQAQYLKQIVDNLGIDQMHLAGNSMGGRISLAFTHKFQYRVKSLALFNSAGVNAPNPSEFNKLLEQGKNIFDIKSKKDFDLLMALSMSSPPFLPWPVKSIKYQQYLARNTIHQKIYNDITQELWGVKDILHTIQVPVFILWGKEDKLIDVSCVPIFENKLANTKTVILENTGHCPMLEKPKLSAKHYLEFLSHLE